LKKEIKAVIELASFETFNETHLDFLGPINRKYRYRVEHDRDKLEDRAPAGTIYFVGR